MPADPQRWPQGRRLRVVLDFQLFEALTASRLGIGLRTFALVTALLGGVGLVVVLAVALVLLHVWRGAADAGAFADQALAAATALTLYAGCSAYLQETFTQRRFAVSRCANADLFRALDVDLRDVVVVYRGLRVTCALLPVLLVDVAAVAVARPAGARGVLWCLVLAACLGAAWLVVLARAARNARQARTAPLAGARAAVPALAATVLGGWVAGRLLAGPAAEVEGAPVLHLPPVALGLLALTAVLVAAAALRVVRRELRLLGEEPFPVAPPGPARARRRRVPAAGGPPGVRDHLYLLADLARPSWQAEALRTVLLVHLLAVAGCAGAALGGADLVGTLLRWGLDRQALVVVAANLALVVAMVVVELVVTSAGPSRTSLHLRSQWELGADLGRLAGAGLLWCCAAPLLAGTAVGAVVLLLGGPLVPACLSLPAAFAAGAVVADCLLAPPRNADGSTVATSSGFLVALVLSLPVVALTVAGVPGGGPLGLAYSAVLLLGASSCLRSRVLHHPSSSSTSVLGTTPTDPSSTAAR